MASRCSALARFCMSVLFFLSIAACGGGGTVEGTGAVEVVTQTTGTDVDPDGYEVQLDGSPPMSIGVDDTVLFEHRLSPRLDRPMKLTGPLVALVLCGMISLLSAPAWA